MKSSRALNFSIFISCSLALVSAACAATITTNNSVAATAVIYAAGNQSGLASSVGGTTPSAITLASGSSYFTFSVPQVGGVAQTITLNNGTGNNYNDADGGMAAVSSSFNSGYGSISGITAPGAGYLVGLFLAAGGPTGTAPSSLSYTTTSFTSATPLLDQVFFIGDGLIGDGTGSTQFFSVPTGATTLYLGISDAGGYSGAPGAYGDNVGSFNVVAHDVTTSVAVTPEPSSLLLLGTGALGVAGVIRRRFAAV